MTLTIRETENARRQVAQAIRKRLDTTRPNPEHYRTHTDRATAIVTSALTWSRAFLLVIALLASLASAIRTVTAVYEIYDLRTGKLIAALAALAFALAADGAIFVLGLAQEGQRLQRVAAGKPRRVTSLISILRAIAVRLGLINPLQYDELDSDSLTTVIAIAFLFILASNAYIGLQPLVAEAGATSTQDFLLSLQTAHANLQLKFVVDMAAVLFPPLMALIAGHQTARFAAEVAAQASDQRAAYEHDLAAWRTAYANPLDTDEGQELLTEAIQLKEAAKTARKDQPQPPTDPFHHNTNGNGRHAREHEHA